MNKNINHVWKKAQGKLVNLLGKNYHKITKFALNLVILMGLRFFLCFRLPSRRSYDTKSHFCKIEILILHYSTPQDE